MSSQNLGGISSPEDTSSGNAAAGAVLNDLKWGVRNDESYFQKIEFGIKIWFLSAFSPFFSDLLYCFTPAICGRCLIRGCVKCWGKVFLLFPFAKFQTFLLKSVGLLVCFPNRERYGMRLALHSGIHYTEASMTHGPLSASLPLQDLAPGIGERSAVSHDGREHPYLQSTCHAILQVVYSCFSSF